MLYWIALDCTGVPNKVLSECTSDPGKTNQKLPSAPPIIYVNEC